MATDPPPRSTEAMLLRAWSENHATPLRVVVTRMRPDGRELTSSVVTSADELCDIVRSWLDDLLRKWS